jgi:phosphate:Na+ symporter
LIITLIGGIGIFLLGMVLLTDGLKAAAGSALRDVLGRLTGGRLTAVASGAAITAVVQSSSATTLATIGFVSAGLLTFPQSIGVIFGASIGTTSTGWIVSLLGLKANVAMAALPLIATGALMRLLGRDRVASYGLALAGFGLIFIGIEFMQDGMAGLADGMNLGAIAADGVSGRLFLALLGIAMTVLMQSSSAANATTLTAVHAGAIDIEAAAALVVGQSIGTTVTAVLAWLGASVPARQTAMAHIGLSVFTGVVAFVILPLVPRMADAAGLADDPAIAIAAFHTVFRFLGVMLLLPFTNGFARGIERLLADHGSPLTRHLDPSVAAVPPVALEVARRTLLGVTGAAFATAHSLLEETPRPHVIGRQSAEARAALVETRQFMGRVHTSPDSRAEHARHINLLHALDHLDRLLDALDEAQHATTVRGTETPREAGRRLAHVLDTARPWCAMEPVPSPVAALAVVSAALADQRRRHRSELLVRAATRLHPDEAMRQIDAMLWLDRIGYHAWRATVHLEGEADPVPPEAYTDPEPVPQTEAGGA